MPKDRCYNSVMMSVVCNKIWYVLNGPVETVCESIAKWEPDDISNETAIETSLYNHLGEDLKGLDIRRQYPHDRIKADILVKEEVAIEIKLNLTTTAEFHRLIGQLEGYARWGVRMIVLLVGQVDSDLKKRVEERLRKDWDDEDEARVVRVTG